MKEILITYRSFFIAKNESSLIFIYGLSIQNTSFVCLQLKKCIYLFILVEKCMEPEIIIVL